MDAKVFSGRGCIIQAPRRPKKPIPEAPETDVTRLDADVHPSGGIEVEEEVTGGVEERHEEDLHGTSNTAAADEKAVVKEMRPEKPKLPGMESSIHVLSYALRPRLTKGRKPPSAPVPNPETGFISQLEADVKAALIVEERKPEPLAPVIEKGASQPKPI
ncbi:hypothetical protein BGZ99_006150 [Dissophora globulifera]|uniref:Uncharacterized protein n=1 Tax=Dissophora globulifera TaxID=979702 RepID=A0A9P6UZU7_9FUNG|nr:hypothetical protein BGZ99_006150 [Dissophora globulifera]